MPTPDTRTTELHSLIDQAAKMIRQQTENQHTLSARKHNNITRKLAPILLLTCIVLIVSLLFSSHIPPSRQQVTAELDQIIEQARSSIEAQRGKEGTLPAAIPDASIAAVVEYVPETDRYRLSASVLGVRVTLEQDGGKTVRYGEAP